MSANEVREMRALQIVALGEIRVQDVAVTEIAADEVLVKVAGAGLCHSDLHVLHSTRWPIFPMTLGHETAGRVAAIGAGVAGLAEGDAVLVYLVWACGHCRACVEGRDNECLTFRGLPPCPGLGPTGAWRNSSRCRPGTSSRSARSTRRSPVLSSTRD